MPAEISIVWTIITALLLYFMHGGFGFFEAGMCRAKNTVDTLSHNLMVLAVTTLVYWAFGFAFMFGDGNGFIGYSGFAPRLVGSSDNYPSLAIHIVPLAVAFAFSMSYADTPATLIAGTGAERIQFSAVMLLTVVISGLLFPIVGHWILGGGWLAQLDVPVYDIGSGVIHLTGGICALAAGVVLGPRMEHKSESEGEEEDVSSMPLVFLGAFILWLGFFAFNAGFAMVAGKPLGLVVVNTALGGSAGTVTGMIGAELTTGKARLRTAMVGLLTGNVAVLSSTAIVEPWIATTIGAAAGLLAVGSIHFWAYLKVDDPTEYLTMNVVGGILGIIAVGLFASPEIMAEYPAKTLPRAGLFYGGGSAQLISQALATGAIIGFVLPAALFVCWILRSMGWLRIPAEEEKEGSDKATHGEDAYEDK
ncbi:ammonium transporter [Microbulbifer rhizosphaerae]|uniref:Amt family ammonium transporter n=1 Tax=Microbulbifer rhizosphaerae TaxID=1562603 RepID=A0A7W4WE94_9GAMM|nr:hypothetical protein [Microbulbifer rhizosphaerae]MBB3062657.1 Amt family ammonium transporter [Microbulbifer rhizosphaerae]